MTLVTGRGTIYIKVPLGSSPVFKKSYYILIASILSATLSLLFATYQLTKTQRALSETNDSLLKNMVNASYDIIDTAANESIKIYLKGISDTIVSSIHIDKNLTEAQRVKSITSLLNIGASGYAYLLSPNGEILSHPYLHGNNLFDLPHIKEQLSSINSFNEYQWANPHESTLRQKVAYSTVLASGNTLVITCYKDELLYLINTDKLKNTLKKYTYGKSGYIYISDAEGNLILHPTLEKKNIAEVIGQSSAPLIKNIKNKPEGQFTYEFNSSGNKIKKHVYYKYYSYLDWVIAAGISIDEFNYNQKLLIGSLLSLLISLISIVTLLTVVLKQRHEALLTAAKLDYLTDLRARRSLIEAAYEAIALRNDPKTQPLGTILFDIDHFKQINDQFGHKEGDCVIKAIAKVLKSFDCSNQLVGRYGGEEFIIITFDLNPNQLYQLAETIRQQIATTQTNHSSVTISAGCYVSFTDYELEHVINCADQALYDAKDSGRNNTKLYKEKRGTQSINRLSGESR